jgi:hypothetical protein
MLHVLHVRRVLRVLRMLRVLRTHPVSGDGDHQIRSGNDDVAE